MSVIFSRAPLRISLGGGGTDLPSYYREHGGFLVSGAIDKYAYMLTHTVLPAALSHEVLGARGGRRGRARSAIRSCARRCCATGAAAPSRSPRWPMCRPGTGMGSSGAYTVCLLKGLARARRTAVTPSELAESACEIEIDVLGEPVGKQDPYVAAHGGICAYTFHPDGRVDVESLELDATTLRRMRDQLLLFYTGEARAASRMLERPRQALQGRRRGNAREPASYEGDRPAQPRAAARGQARAVRRADARALGRQAPALAGDDRRAHRRPVCACAPQRRRRRQARRRRRRRLPARCTPIAPRTHGARWRR